jgi:cell division protease FtsH
MRENEKVIKSRHFHEAIDKVILGEKLDKKPSKYELERVSIHESGHALVSELVKPGSVSSLTIVPRGRALGFMRKSAQDDQYLYTREELESDIMVALAGAVAEEIRYGNRSTGASNDFEQCWNLSRQIVECGLSDLGIINSQDIPDKLVYDECKAIISSLEKKTQDLIMRNKKSLMRIAEKIIMVESLDRDSLVELIKAG